MEKIYFTIPRNYKETSKFLGAIRYSSAFAICLWGTVLYLIFRKVPINFWAKAYCIIFLFIPTSILSCIDIQNESVFRYIIYIYKFIKNKKKYIFTK